MAKASRDKGNEHAGFAEEDRGYETPCWIWRGGTNADGRYGRCRNPRTHKLAPAHRVYYERRHGPVASDLQMDHLCRVTLCVNPDHLEPVTATENVRRSMALTPGDVAEIRNEGERLKRPGRRRPKGSRVAIAQRYGVNVKTIRNIWAGATWAE